MQHLQYYSAMHIRGLLVTGVIAALLASVLMLGVPADAVSSGHVPSPTVTGPITGGVFGRPFTSSPVPLGPAGYTEQEYFISGVATGYQQANSWGSDGRWAVKPAEQAPYRTRILVRRPADQARFNGTVVVEWLNVSIGTDLDPDYLYESNELLRAGYAWVGVSAQQQGVAALKNTDPARYGSLNHPGDTFSYSIFSQAGQALLGAPGVDPLGGMRPNTLIADGESQSAFRMVTYANAIHPIDRLFDGFLIHSRGANSAPISQAPQADQPTPSVVSTRTDLTTPVLTVQTESDVLAPLNYYPARQPDSSTFRLWEIAGTSHADASMLLLSKRELAPFPPTPPAPHCTLPPNNGQQRYVMDDALAQLTRWILGGVPATHAARIEIVEGQSPTIARDQYGNAIGGIRTPALQVPIATLTGTGNSGPDWQCALLGTTTPFSAAQLQALYPSHDHYVRAVTRAAINDTAAGFLLPADARQIIATAASAAIPE